jgi:hypothetical protein
MQDSNTAIAQARSKKTSSKTPRLVCFYVNNYPKFEDAVVDALYNVEMTGQPIILCCKYGNCTIIPFMGISEILNQFKRKMRSNKQVSADEKSKILEILDGLVAKKESGIFYKALFAKQASTEK